MLTINQKKEAFKAFKNTPQIVDIMNALDKDVYMVARWYIEEAIHSTESQLVTSLVHPEEVEIHNAKIKNLDEMRKIEALVEVILEGDDQPEVETVIGRQHVYTDRR